jgi:hypothetical protein
MKEIVLLCTQSNVYHEMESIGTLAIRINRVMTSARCEMSLQETISVATHIII